MEATALDRRGYHLRTDTALENVIFRDRNRSQLALSEVERFVLVLRSQLIAVICCVPLDMLPEVPRDKT